MLLEVTEFSSILEEITDAELEFLSDSMIDEIVEEVFAEALEDGDDIDVMETLLCESIEASLTLLQEDAGAEARKRLMSKSPRASKLDRIKSAVKKGAQVARKAVVKGSEVAGKAVGHAKNLAKDMGSAAKKGYKSTQSSSSDSSSDSETRKPQTYRNQGVTKKKPGMLSKIGSKLKSGLKKAVGKTARAVSRGARNVARRMGEETELQEKELSIDQQMKISRDAAAKRKPYQPGDRQKQRAAQLKQMAKNAKKDTRTDAQKMTDATGPRPGSRYRGD